MQCQPNWLFSRVRLEPASILEIVCVSEQKSPDGFKIHTAFVNEMFFRELAKVGNDVDDEYNTKSSRKRGDDGHSFPMPLLRKIHEG